MIPTKKKFGLLQHRAVGIALNAVLFATNFLLFFFIVSSILAEITGYLRLGLCWVGAYTMTWVMSMLAKGAFRLVLTLVFIVLLFIVLKY